MNITDFKQQALARLGTTPSALECSEELFARKGVGNKCVLTCRDGSTVRIEAGTWERVLELLPAGKEAS